jgi:hypothetical protein
MAITSQQAFNYIRDTYPASSTTFFSGPYDMGDGRVEITKNRTSDTVVMERFHVDLSNGIYTHFGRYGEYLGSGIVPADYDGSGGEAVG